MISPSLALSLPSGVSSLGDADESVETFGSGDVISVASAVTVVELAAVLMLDLRLVLWL